MRELASLAGVDVPALPHADIPDDHWPMLRQIASNNQLYVQTPTSSASGHYQFIRSIWLGEGGERGPTLRPAFGGLKLSAEEQPARAQTFTAKNAAYLRGKGIPINRASLYASHFFGPVVAAQIIGADVMRGRIISPARVRRTLTRRS